MIRAGWHDIPGFEGKYQINLEGEVRNLTKGGVIVKQRCFARNSGAPTVQLYVGNRECRHFKVVQLMVKTFHGGLPKGKVAYHKNGLITDNSLGNIGFCTRKELGRMQAAPLRRPVAITDHDDNVLEIYPSATEAGRRNFCGKRYVLERCHHRIINEYSERGTTFRFDDDPCLRK